MYFRALDEIHLSAVVKKIALCILNCPDIPPSQRLLFPRAVAEAEAANRSYHTHCMIFNFSGDLTHIQILSKHTLSLVWYFPHLCLNLIYTHAYPVPTKHRFFSMQTFLVPPSRVSTAVYYVEKKIPETCCSCQVAMHPRITHFSICALLHWVQEMLFC